MHRTTTGNPSATTERAAALAAARGASSIVAAVAAAIALAALLACFPPTALAAGTAYGEGGAGDRDLTISATVAEPAPVVIKVEVPSSAAALDIRIRTSVLDGRFLGFAAAKGEIRNLPESTVPISAAVSEVADGANGRARALGYLGVAITGDRTVELVEGAGKSDVIVDHLAPGSTAPLTVDVRDKTGGAPIPDGAYGMSATIKIAAA